MIKIQIDENEKVSIISDTEIISQYMHDRYNIQKHVDGMKEINLCGINLCGLLEFLRYISYRKKINFLIGQGISPDIEMIGAEKDKYLFRYSDEVVKNDTKEKY